MEIYTEKERRYLVFLFQGQEYLSGPFTSN
jgi:hypothetical protein